MAVAASAGLSAPVWRRRAAKVYPNHFAGAV